MFVDKEVNLQKEELVRLNNRSKTTPIDKQEQARQVRWAEKYQKNCLDSLWAQFVGGDLFRADLSRIAVDADGGILGFALCSANPEDWEVQGFTSCYVGVLGVVREARGRGIAPALLEGVLRATAEAGLERVVLDVDTESPTGALGLYERSGFVATSRSMTVARDL